MLLVPTDYVQLKAMGDIAADMMKQCGMNVDYVSTDWGTMLQRRTKKTPIDQGGWSCYCVTWAGLSMSTPGSSYPLRANGAAASTGWPTAA